MSRRIRWAIIGWLILLLACAGPRKIGETRVVEESSSKPWWVKKEKVYFEKKGILYFKGIAFDRKDLALGLREAKAEAIKNVAEKIAIRVRDEFKKAVEGVNVPEGALSQFVSDAVSWVTDNLDIQGLALEESYWQRVEKTEPQGVSYFYNVYGLVSIPESDYIQSRNRAIQRLMERYSRSGQEEAKRTAEEVWKRLQNQ